ncbi:hypothetical protein BGW39_008896, partial [Mortierella sp. 14UC]
MSEVPAHIAQQRQLYHAALQKQNAGQQQQQQQPGYGSPNQAAYGGYQGQQGQQQQQQYYQGQQGQHYGQNASSDPYAGPVPPPSGAYDPYGGALQQQQYQQQQQQYGGYGQQQQQPYDQQQSYDQQQQYHQQQQQQPGANVSIQPLDYSRPPDASQQQGYQQPPQPGQVAPPPSSQQGGAAQPGANPVGGEYPLLVAIDFGTTFSGVAYAFKQNGEVLEMTTWPHQANLYGKVPTISAYSKENDKLHSWGYAAKAAMLTPNARNLDLLQKFKLFLDNDLAPYLPPLPRTISPQSAISDYLRALHNHAITEILKNGGGGMIDPQHHIQYCLTVPAM